MGRPSSLPNQLNAHSEFCCYLLYVLSKSKLTEEQVRLIDINYLLIIICIVVNIFIKVDHSALSGLLLLKNTIKQNWPRPNIPEQIRLYLKRNNFSPIGDNSFA
jgi:hypothetical protein